MSEHQPLDPDIERPLTPAELKARGRRNLAIAGALVLFVILIFVVTLVRMRGAGLVPHP